MKYIFLSKVENIKYLPKIMEKNVGKQIVNILCIRFTYKILLFQFVDSSNSYTYQN